MSGLLNDPVLLLGLMAFGALLLALPLAFWNLSGEPRSSTSRVVQLLVVLVEKYQELYVMTIKVLKW